MRKEHRVIRSERDRDDMAAFVSGLSPEKPWEITVQHHRPHRTLSQNALLHKWLSEISDATGHTDTELKEIYRKMFLMPETKMFDGKQVEIPKSTTDLDTREMTDFMNNIYAHAAGEMGIFLTLPEEQGRRG